MILVANVLVALVALIHLYFLVLEMFLWTKPYGRRVFGNSPEQARDSAKLAAHQGLYNGINLMGLDIARLYLALRKRPSLTIPEFLAQEETFYRVTIPASKHFDLLKFYPWLLAQKAEGAPVAWEVSFNRAGVPLKIAPSTTRVSEPQLSYVKKSSVDPGNLTRDQVAGRGESAHLTDSGKRLMRLLIFPD